MEFVSSASTALTFLLAAGLFARAGSHPANRYLAAFFLIPAISKPLMAFSGEWRWLAYQFCYSTEWFAVPLLYGYFLFSSGERQSPRWGDLLHLVPGVLFFSMFVSGDVGAFKESVRGGLGIPTKAVVLQQAMYLGLSARLCLRNPVSKKLWILLWIFVLVWLFGAIDAFALARESSDLFNTALAVAVFSLGLLGLIDSPWLLSEMPILARKSLIPTEDLSPKLAKLDRIMAETKPHKDSLCSLKKVAKLMGMSPHALSELINKGTGRNFNDYINSFRIEEAKSLLRESKMSVLDVSLETGFNSKSTFYSAFRKHAGVAPLDYRQSAVTGETGTSEIQG